MKVFVKVVDNMPRQKEAHEVVAEAQDKVHAQVFVKVAQVGEFQVIDGQTVFRSK